MSSIHFDTMGTTASAAFRLPLDEVTGLPAIREDLERIENRFSLYRPGSEISRIARGDIRLAEASETFLAAYSAAIEWKLQTHGAFDPHRPDGVIDLSGIVKALAIRGALDLLRTSGIADALFSIGGDGGALGAMSPDRAWSAGVLDPDDRGRLLCAIPLASDHAAIATSGTAERGEHVWRRSAPEFRQVTVIAPDIVTADVLATAVLSGGRAMLDEATAGWDVDVLTVDDDGALEVTPRLRKVIARSPLPGLRA